MSNKNDPIINIYDANNNYSSLASRIKNELVDNTYYNDVKRNLRGRSYWKLVGDVFEFLSKIVIGVASILAFASGYFGYDYMSFLSGCTSILSLVFLQFSSYAMKESKERNEIVNRIFRKIGLDEMVDISTDINNENLVKMITSNKKIIDPNNLLLVSNNKIPNNKLPDKMLHNKFEENLEENLDEKIDEKFDKKSDEKFDEKSDEKFDGKSDEKFDEKSNEKLEV